MSEVVSKLSMRYNCNLSLVKLLANISYNKTTSDLPGLPWPTVLSGLHSGDMRRLCNHDRWMGLHNGNMCRLCNHDGWVGYQWDCTVVTCVDCAIMTVEWDCTVVICVECAIMMVECDCTIVTCIKCAIMTVGVGLHSGDMCRLFNGIVQWITHSTDAPSVQSNTYI